MGSDPIAEGSGLWAQSFDAVAWMPREGLAPVGSGADQVLEAAFASKIISWRNLRFVLYAIEKVWYNPRP